MPSPDTWLSLGELNNIHLFLHHEYYRLVTALTLHADAAHLTGNIFFGLIFLYILSRIIGPGRALLYTILGGICGNFLSALIHSFSYKSIGFSTAIFASLGILGGIMSVINFNKRSFLLVTGAILGILAMLGTEGQHTDYSAHTCGLGCGFILGLLEGWGKTKHLFGLSQIKSAFTALLILYVAWFLAFTP